MSEFMRELDRQGVTEEKKYFLKVLDDVVSLDENSLCHPDMRIRKRLVSFEIASFSCFVFSGIMEKTVKLFIYVYHEDVSPQRKRFNLVPFYFSIYGTMCGCFFLVLAMVDVIKVKLGRLSCGSKYSVNPVLILLVTIRPTLLTYFISVSYGLFFAKRGPDATAAGRGIEKV